MVWLLSLAPRDRGRTLHEAEAAGVKKHPSLPGLLDSLESRF